jgi:hypothetical protein
LTRCESCFFRRISMWVNAVSVLQITDHLWPKFIHCQTSGYRFQSRQRVWPLSFA